MPTNKKGYCTEYIKNNPDKLAFYKRPIYCHVCDCEVFKSKFKRHESSKKHIANLSKNLPFDEEKPTEKIIKCDQETQTEI